MDLNALEALLQKGDIGTVVATIGTTGTGSVDPPSRESSGFSQNTASASMRTRLTAAISSYPTTWTRIRGPLLTIFVKLIQ